MVDRSDCARPQCRVIRPSDPPAARRALPPAAERGRLGEGIAARYLEMAGYQILARNLRCPPLEIDLVARRGPVVALVEVRTRSSRTHGRPEESVRWRKRACLRRAAGRLHQVIELPAGTQLRLDLIAILREAYGLRLRHLQGFAALAPR